MNNRQSYWEAILRSEGLAPIEFASRGMIESSADHHNEMTNNDRPHWVDEEQIARLRDIIVEFRLPVQHRIVLTAIVDGHPIRAAAQFAAINKDKAHRIVLRYLDIKRATNAELYDLPLHLSTNPRRIEGRKRMSPREATREGTRRSWQRPPAASELTRAYFDRAKQFCSHAEWQWLLDREIWTAHANARSRDVIARELGMPPGTVLRAIRRVRKQFYTWLRQRNIALPNKEENE